MIALRDQAYGLFHSADRSFDFFRPNSSDVLPLVIFVHGGGWISGDKTMYRDEALWLADQGYATASIGYRLAPIHTFPAAVEDVQTFLCHARSHAKELDIDPTKIVVMGNSAGGHLALMAAYCTEDLVSGEPVEAPRGVVSVCGITDLRDYENSHFPIALAFIEQFMAGRTVDRHAVFEKASPICHVHKGAPTTILLHGSEDEIVPVAQAHSLYSELKRLGVESELHELKGEGHVFSFPGWLKVRERLLALLDRL